MNAPSALSMCHPLPEGTRRDFLDQGATVGMSSIFLADGSNGDLALFDTMKNSFSTNEIFWDDVTRVPPSWSSLRYGTSTVKTRVPAATERLATFPEWSEGYWLTTCRFERAKFPLGRDKLTLRVPGAGLGTCVALPNIGYNPSPFVTRLLSYEDMAYNTPRKFEAFWPLAKVTSIQTAQFDRAMTPQCLVTGEGCTERENPMLHSPHATRVRFQFEGPTRSGGFRKQTIDFSVVDQESAITGDGFVVRRNYVQYNVEQELQCFFQESLLLTSAKDSRDKMRGRIRVAAFLPQRDNEAPKSYDDSQALAVYDYSVSYKAIDEAEASQI